MRTTVAASLSALLITAGSLASAEAAPPVVRGEYTPYSYALTSKIACKTRTNNDGVEQISWIPEYHMTGDENHAAKKIYVKVRVDPNDSKKKGTWTTGKKTSVTPGEPFSKWKRVATPWVGVKRERDLMTHIVFHRTTSAGDFVGRGSLTELPTADSGECEAE